MGQLIKITNIPGTEPVVADTPDPEPTTEERITALEEELKVAKIVLGWEE